MEDLSIDKVVVSECVDWWAGKIGLYDYRFEISLLSDGKYFVCLDCAGEVTVSEDFETESKARAITHLMLESVMNELGEV